MCVLYIFSFWGWVGGTRRGRQLGNCRWCSNAWHFWFQGENVKASHMITSQNVKQKIPKMVCSKRTYSSWSFLRIELFFPISRGIKEINQSLQVNNIVPALVLKNQQGKHPPTLWAAVPVLDTLLYQEFVAYKQFVPCLVGFYQLWQSSPSEHVQLPTYQPVRRYIQS